MLEELHLLAGSISLPTIAVQEMGTIKTPISMPCLRTLHIARFLYKACAATHLLSLISPHPELFIHFEGMFFRGSISDQVLPIITFLSA